MEIMNRKYTVIELIFNLTDEDVLIVEWIDSNDKAIPQESYSFCLAFLYWRLSWIVKHWVSSSNERKQSRKRE